MLHLRYLIFNENGSLFRFEYVSFFFVYLIFDFLFLLVARCCNFEKNLKIKRKIYVLTCMQWNKKSGRTATGNNEFSFYRSIEIQRKWNFHLILYTRRKRDKRIRRKSQEAGVATYEYFH